MPATGKHAPWRLWILVITWILQLLFLLMMLSIYTLVAISFGVSSYVISTGAYAAVGVELACIVICLSLIIAEIVLTARCRLSPPFFLISNIIKSAIWVGLTIATIINSNGLNDTTDQSQTTKTVRIGGCVALFLLFLLPTLYSAIIFQKTRRSAHLLATNYKQPPYPSTILTTANTPYVGAPVPRPDYVDVEDGTAGGFQKITGAGMKVSQTEME